MAHHPLALGCALAATLLGAGLPARAAIILAGADAAADVRMKQEAHRAGARHRSVVGIYLLGRAAWPPVGTGTGVYIGPNAKGDKGLILTAAHLFRSEPRKGGRIVLAFGSDLATSHPVNAERVLIHPGFTPGGQPALPGAEEKLSRMEVDTLVDLALVEFDLAAHAKALADRGVTAADLWEGKEEPDPTVVTGEMVGFGVFGTTRNTVDATNVRVHAGNTLVSHTVYCGRRLFINWAPVPHEVARQLEAGAQGPALLFQFEPAETPIEAQDPSGRDRHRLQTHRNHAVPAHGDSGGPLFLETPDGPRVAGINSRSENCVLIRSDTQARIRAIASIWEPLTDHLLWIQGVRAGVPGLARVLEVGPGLPAPEGETKSWCVIL
ncbi:MAG: trypsin-like peptidase domain-containing protein [Holophaga sp.]|nr:trypsin-like peptidase domain-containing protein [Holophaga sp.]